MRCKYPALNLCRQILAEQCRKLDGFDNRSCNLHVCALYIYADGNPNHHFRAAEATAGIICGNLPSLPAFIKHFRAKYHDSKSGSRTEPPSDHEMTVARNNEQYLSSPDQMPDLIFVQETPVVEGSQDEV